MTAGDEANVVPIDPNTDGPYCCAMEGHAVIVGFGLPGRAAINALEAVGVLCCVVELNAATVRRCARAGLPIIEGDAAEVDTLHRANVQSASRVVVTLPDDAVTLRVIAEVRRLNPTAPLIARMSFVSTGMKATAAGATEVVVAEQVVAEAVGRLLGSEVALRK